MVPKKLLLMLLTILALAACDNSRELDQDQLDQLERDNRRILRQLGGG